VISSETTSTYGADFFANLSLLPGEDVDKYKALFEMHRTTIDPADIFEQFLIGDLTHQTWECLRWRRLLVALHAGGKQMGLESVLRPLVHGCSDTDRIGVNIFGADPIRPLDKPELRESETLALGYVKGEREAVDKVETTLRDAGLDWNVVQAEIAALRSSELQRITQLLAKAESRRNATLRAIERHRDGLGATLRRVAQDFETAETRKPAAVREQKLAA
jgi:hypothetical protein